MTPQTRADILQAVAKWLDAHGDDALAGLPPGFDPATVANDDAIAREPRAPLPDAPLPDLATVIGILTACRHDVQVQGKAVKRLEESLASGVAELRTAMPARTPERSDELCDLHDRLRRCFEACRDAATSVGFVSTRARVVATLSGIERGIELTLAHASQLLASRGLRAFESTGQPFDPARMEAVGAVPATGERRAGTVVQTLSAGFERDGVVVRNAKVTVAR